MLDNKYEAWEKWKARKNQQQKSNKRKPSSSSKKAQMETAFHYIAYVPVNGQVWELDGLETQPRCIGKDHLPFSLHIFLPSTSKVEQETIPLTNTTSLLRHVSRPLPGP